MANPRRRAKVQSTNESPLWFRLLREKREVDGKTGLTIPFLIGATQIPLAPPLDRDEAFRQLADLFTQMRDVTPSAHSVRVAWCDKTHEPIAAVYKISELMADNEAIANSSGRRTLYVQDRYCPNRKWGLDSVLDYFWRKDQHALTHGLYSFNDGEYRAFNADDLKWIARVRR